MWDKTLLALLYNVFLVVFIEQCYSFRISVGPVDISCYAQRRLILLNVVSISYHADLLLSIGHTWSYLNTCTALPELISAILTVRSIEALKMNLLLRVSATLVSGARWPASHDVSHDNTYILNQ